LHIAGTVTGRLYATDDPGLDEIADLTERFRGMGALSFLLLGNEEAYRPKVGELLPAYAPELVPSGDFAGIELSEEPADLFYGTGSTKNDPHANELCTVPIWRLTGQVIVKVRGLREYTDATTDDTDFTVLVKSSRGTAEIPGQESLAGDYYYRLAGAFATNGDYNCDMTRIFASEEGEDISILLYHGAEQIDEVSLDAPGYGLTVYNGRQTEVRVGYKTNLSGSAAAYLQVVVQEAQWWNTETIWIYW
jgi:hypothetical protein